MPKYKKWCSGCVQCPKCDWVYLPHTKDWEWHNQNCEYMAGMKERIISRRRVELKEQRKLFLEK